jgi:hypothetical protein
MASLKSHWSFEYISTCINIWHLLYYICRSQGLSTPFYHTWVFLLMNIICSYFIFMSPSSLFTCLGNITNPIHFNSLLLSKNSNKRKRNWTICDLRFLINKWPKFLNNNNNQTCLFASGHLEPVLWFPRAPQAFTLLHEHMGIRPYINLTLRLHSLL